MFHRQLRVSVVSKECGKPCFLLNTFLTQKTCCVVTGY